jgi:hypothetical protein
MITSGGRMSKFKGLLKVGTFALCASAANASLISQGSQVFQATGLGTVPTILTVQAKGTSTTAYGCVASIGGADVIGGAACNLFPTSATAPGMPTDTTFTQMGQTQTQLATSAVNVANYSGGVTGYGNIALVVNFSQTGQVTPITLNDLRITLTNGASSWTSTGLNCGSSNPSCTFAAISPGTGISGYVFTLDQAQQAAAAAAIGAFSSNVRVGADIRVSNATGAPESVFLGAVPAGTPVPEPATLAMTGLGLLAAGYFGKVRLKASKRT